MNINAIGASCLGWVVDKDGTVLVDGKVLFTYIGGPPDVDIQGEPTGEQIVNVQRLVDKAIEDVGAVVFVYNHVYPLLVKRDGYASIDTVVQLFHSEGSEILRDAAIDVLSAMKK